MRFHKIKLKISDNWRKGENLLLILTVFGVVTGLVIGIILSSTLESTATSPKMSPRAIEILRFPGTLFLRALKLLILPLITSSLINSIVNLDPSKAGRVGLYACLYYLTTTLLAVITGIVIVSIIRPGSGGLPSGFAANSMTATTCGENKAIDTIMDLLRNMIPDNIIDAMILSESGCVANSTMVNSTWYSQAEYKKLRTEYPDLPETPQWYDDISYKDKKGMNVLGLVAFSLVFGYFVSTLNEKARAIAVFFAGLECVIMRMVEVVIWFSPIGICFLIAAEIVNVPDPVTMLSNLALYMATVLAGLAIHAFVTLPLLLFFVGRRNPFKYSYGMLQAYLTAFGTSSSSATMPITMECVEYRNNVNEDIAKFVIPLGATINMDGTALYEAVAAIYISQSLDMPMSAGDVILISLTSTLASIGAAGIPQAGLVTMIIILIAIGIDPKYSTLIIPIDWLLDRVRTTVNVHGDAYGAAIVQRLAGAANTDVVAPLETPNNFNYELTPCYNAEQKIEKESLNRNGPNVVSDEDRQDKL